MAQFWVGSSVVLSLQQRLDCTEFGLANWHPNKIIGHQLFLAHPMVQLNTDFW